MTSRLGIELLTVFGMPPVDHINLAAELGCSVISIGLRSVPMRQLGVPDWSMFPDWSLTDDPALTRETKAALRDTGVQIGLGEGFGVRPGADVANHAAGLALMAELGAERINAISLEPDTARAHDQLATLCDMVTARGMTFTIEFAPPNAIAGLSDALAAIDHIGRGKCRLLIDAMHFFRSGATVAELAALDPELIGYVQLCDVPLAPAGDNYMRQAMFERMVPGKGELPLAAFVAALADNVPVSLEVPNLARVLAAGSPVELTRDAVAAARTILDHAKELKCPA